MQRSKSSVSFEVKQVIGALCRLLVATGLESVPSPEAFRRAKFGGGPEVEDRFWRLLANILQTSGDEAAAQLGREHRKLVAAGLWQTGYHADWMYEKGGGGGGGEGGRFSSRDLLLAFGWLLADGKLEKLLTQRVQQLDKTLLTPTPVNLQLSGELQFNAASLRRLQWLTGGLRHQGRTLLSMQEERARLLHAISVASLSSSSSCSDQSSAVLKEDCVCVQQICDLLEAYLTWKQVEKVFWTWMDSVVDCHLTDPVPDKKTPNGTVPMCHHGNRGLERLEDMLLRLPIGQGREDAEGRGGGGGGRLQMSLDSSPFSPLPSSLSGLQVYRARLHTGRPVKPSGLPVEGLRGGAEAPDELPVSQAVKQLLHTETVLLERRNGRRLFNKMQLQEMIGRMEELVLIPP